MRRVMLSTAIRPAVGFTTATRLPAVRFASSTSDHLPMIAQKSLWMSIVPKFLQQKNRQRKDKPKNSFVASLTTNPATFFIVMFILIGSMSINLLGMRNEFKKFTRRTDTRIELLKEVIGRLQAGEKFDVDRALGAGDEVQEKEWEDMVNQLASDVSSKPKQPKKETTTEAEPAKIVAQPAAQPQKAKGFSSFF
ncbi:hypothetical protein TD95_002873 [Thielaviopsis punctulata]|uniref:Uncharacterized protein n=1 Tax=Thielaviopsis punctulata TaxID=72032 RepID=A0A0F4ZE75_9PEZI|nr:hypothetical protein TD95_002873 [Thielaviopsis punctulata]